MAHVIELTMKGRSPAQSENCVTFLTEKYLRCGEINNLSTTRMAGAGGLLNQGGTTGKISRP